MKNLLNLKSFSAFFNFKNPLFLGVISGVIVIIIAVTLFIITEYRKRKIYKVQRESCLDNADRLIESGMIDEHLLSMMT